MAAAGLGNYQNNKPLSAINGPITSRHNAYVPPSLQTISMLGKSNTPGNASGTGGKNSWSVGTPAMSDEKQSATPTSSSPAPTPMFAGDEEAEMMLVDL